MALSRSEAGLAVAEVVFPRPPEPRVEPSRSTCGHFSRKRLRHSRNVNAANFCLSGPGSLPIRSTRSPVGNSTTILPASMRTRSFLTTERLIARDALTTRSPPIGTRNNFGEAMSGTGSMLSTAPLLRETRPTTQPNSRAGRGSKQSGPFRRGQPWVHDGITSSQCRPSRLSTSTSQRSGSFRSSRARRASATAGSIQSAS
jgi:hypothetical protein